jgi:hypothetical protein
LVEHYHEVFGCYPGGSGEVDWNRFLVSLLEGTFESAIGFVVASKDLSHLATLEIGKDYEKKHKQRY